MLCFVAGANEVGWCRDFPPIEDDVSRERVIDTPHRVRLVSTRGSGLVRWPLDVPDARALPIFYIGRVSGGGGVGGGVSSSSTSVSCSSNNLAGEESWVHTGRRSGIQPRTSTHLCTWSVL